MGPPETALAVSLFSLSKSATANHICAFVVEQFALTEASHTTVRLQQAFSVVDSRDTEPWTESIGATCTSANGVKVAMTPC